MSEFSSRLRMLREKKGLSYKDLADKVGSTKSLIWTYEKGGSDPGLKAFTALANYFGVTLDWLGGNGDIDNIQYSKSAYVDVINKCIEGDVSPEKLSKLVDAIKEE